MRTYDQQPSGTVARARSLRRHATDAEKAMWSGLRRSFPGVKFRRQVPIGPYFADFLCHAAGLVIEADGGQHDEAKAYDEARTRFIASRGYRVVRYWNNEVLTNLDGVLADVARHLSPSPSQG